MQAVSDAQLTTFIVEADDAALNEGASPKQRTLSVITKVMDRLGYIGFVMAGHSTPDIVKRIVALHSSLYRPSDLAMGGVHGGVYMFRDVFARISIPLGYGMVRIDPFKLTDLTDTQLRWLASRRGEVDAFVDQFVHVCDFAGGIATFGDFKTPPKASMEVFLLAAFQLQAAAATLSVAFDFRGATQSALIGAELALKGGLAALGHDEKARTSHQHNLLSAATAVSEGYPQFDFDKVKRTIGDMPRLVENRYSATQPNRIETGRIAMGAQFIAGEVMRQVTEFSIRNALVQS